MQYSGNSTSQDIVSLANTLTKQNATSFPIEDKTMFANMGNRIILSEIHQTFGWKYDDRNNTDFPIATTDLNATQDNYALPLDLSYLQAVYVKDSAGLWTQLVPLTLEDINDREAEPEFEKTDSITTYYRPLGNSIKVYPASKETVAGGLMIEYSKDVSTFATTDTTKTPGFDIQYHEAVAVYMAYMFELTNGIVTPTGKIPHEDSWIDYLARIKRHYLQKWQEMYPARVKLDYNFNSYL
jgi:hypothetical protein